MKQRWLVPTSLLRDQKDRFRHLAPLRGLAQRLAKDEALLCALVKLELNVYPAEENDRTGPVLLDALSRVVQDLADGVETQNGMPAGGFDVLLGQVRHAWRHFDPSRELPKRFVVRTRPYKFEVRTAANIGDAYLPDHDAHTRSLREHHQPIFAMWSKEARGGIGDLLHQKGARLASELQEHCLVDGGPAADLAEASQEIEVRLEWLPVVLLALAAYGGNQPRGPATGAWLKAKERLQRARVLLCNSIEVELRDANGESVARSEPNAYWVPQDDTLLLDRDVAASGLYETIAPAAQAMLERQDLLKDLRLVLGWLAGHPQPTHTQVEEALGRAEIDGFDVANIRGQCGIRVLRDRIRPVVALVGVSDSGLDDVRDLAALTAWLSEAMPLANGKPLWSSEDLVAVAREARNDFEMGYSAGRVLGEMACLPKWNAALKRLGRGTVRNERVGEQARRYLDQAARSLRAFARYVATACPNSASTEGDHESLDGEAAFFSEVTAVHESLETTADWRDLCAKWSDRWWEVPFSAVLGALRAQYERIDGVKPHLDPFETEEAIEGFKSALKAQGVTLDPDPLEVARSNHDRLSAVGRSVWELYQAWLMMKEADWQIQRVPEIDLDASMFLRPWTDDDVLARAKTAVDKQEFLDAVTRCTTVDEMRSELQISSETLERIREKHRHRARKDTAENRTFRIACRDYEVGGPETYNDLFRRLKQLPEPIGPRAEDDVFTPLKDPSPSVQPDERAGRETGPADGRDGPGAFQGGEALPLGLGRRPHTCIPLRTSQN